MTTVISLRVLLDDDCHTPKTKSAVASLKCFRLLLVLEMEEAGSISSADTKDSEHAKGEYQSLVGVLTRQQDNTHNNNQKHYHSLTAATRVRGTSSSR